MKAAIFGVGNMGQAIIWSMGKFGFEVVAFDKDISKFSAIKHPQNVGYILIDDNDKSTFKILKENKVDVVISSLPYHQLKPVALFCIDNNIKYCDLGGRVDVSREIKEYALSKKESCVFTDLGLAPGYVNIEAEHGLSKVSNAKSVKMMVGGLPTSAETNSYWNHPLYCPINYKVTWSIDGLINEYKDDCLILRKGKIEKVKGMDGLETVSSSIGQLEAFFTSGGMSHSIESMQKYGVKDCAYKTLRYKGHRDIVQWLIRKCELTNEELSKIFKNGCKDKEEKDLVIIKTEVSNEEITWSKERVIYADEKFSAMQKATAFSISSVAKMIAEKSFSNKSVLSYSDVCYNTFIENILFLEKANVRVDD